MTIESDFAVARQSHRAAIAGYLRAATGVPDARWNEPLKPGGWSPAQVTEHLRMAYDMLGGELRGQPGLRVRVPWWLRPILRMRFLPRILSHGEIPAGARAPRELRPGGGPFPKAETLSALETRAAACEVAVGERWDEPGAFATHHVFGKLTPKELLRFAVVHADHHAKQLNPR